MVEQYISPTRGNTWQFSEEEASVLDSYSKEILLKINPRELLEIATIWCELARDKEWIYTDDRGLIIHREMFLDEIIKRLQNVRNKTKD